MKNNISEKLTMIEILKEAIQKEHDSYDYYHMAAIAAVKPSAKRMFLRLAEMELGHTRELKRHLSDLEAQMLIDKALTSSF